MRSEYRKGSPGVGADHRQQSQCHKPVQLSLYPVQVATLPKHTLADSTWF